MEFPRAQVFHIAAVGSYHIPIQVYFDYQDVRTPRSFKFEAVWLDSLDFLRVVRDAWKTMEGIEVQMPMFVIKNLIWCKEALRKWSKVAFPNNKIHVNKLLGEIERCKVGVLTLEKAEKINWWQRSRINWLNASDKNTRFFFTQL